MRVLPERSLESWEWGGGCRGPSWGVLEQVGDPGMEARCRGPQLGVLEQVGTLSTRLDGTKVDGLRLDLGRFTWLWAD